MRLRLLKRKQNNQKLRKGARREKTKYTLRRRRLKHFNFKNEEVKEIT